MHDRVSKNNGRHWALGRRKLELFLTLAWGSVLVNLAITQGRREENLAAATGSSNYCGQGHFEVNPPSEKYAAGLLPLDAESETSIAALSTRRAVQAGVSNHLTIDVD